MKTAPHAHSWVLKSACRWKSQVVNPPGNIPPVTPPHLPARDPKKLEDQGLLSFGTAVPLGMLLTLCLGFLIC